MINMDIINFMNKKFRIMDKKEWKYIIILAVAILIICTFIDFNHIYNVLLLDKNIKNITLTYRDADKANEYYENMDNYDIKERTDAYFDIYININVEKDYWDKIFMIFKNSEYDTMNTKWYNKVYYYLNQPLYSMEIEYKIGNKIHIHIWERLFLINNVFYDPPEDSNEIFTIIENIINDH